MNVDAERIKELFARALGKKSPAEREGYLAEACQGEPELLQQLNSLLRANEQAGDFLAQTVKIPPSEFVDEPGTLIGRFKLLEKIGEGGFGLVYMAEQQEPVQRKVALKIIKAGMDTREVIARFEAERQALALMDHPNIAKVLDGGATQAGRPYFVMELVRGIRITDYCDQNNLSTAERLKLFIRVCQAVQHAHQKGVIHRDIKPSNVLVTLHDGEPVPKVIDFGVAKALGQKLTEKTLFTGFAQMIGTPAYMSPEQAEMSGLDIDTRSDIYSLGVLLYELLTGVTPFDRETFAKAALDEIRRMIRETEPPKPSTRLRTLGAKLTAVAKQRHTEPAVLSRLLQGDLDWIAMKCLEKDRTRRYETANALAEDIERHLHLEPVAACPPSALYRLGKNVRRNKVAFAAGSAVAASLLIGLTLSTVLFFKERAASQRSLQEKRRADEEAAVAAAISEFLQKDLLSHAAPASNSEEKSEPDLKVRSLLDRASQKIEGRFFKQPLVEAGLRGTLARAYHNLGDYGVQERHGARALNIYRQELGETNAQTLAAAGGLGDAKRHLGQTSEAVRLLKHTLDNQQRAMGWYNTNTFYTRNVLALSYCEAGQPKAGQAVLEEGLRLAKVNPGPESEVFADLLSNLSRILAQTGNWPEAETKFHQALAIQRKLHGPESLNVARELRNFAVSLNNSRRPSEAESAFRQSLDLTRRVLGQECLEVASAMRDLAFCLAHQGRFSEAEPILNDVLASQIKLQGEMHLETARALEDLARTLRDEGKFAQSATLFRRAMEIRSRIQVPQSADTIAVTEELAGALVRQEKMAEAETLLREALWPFRQSGNLDTNALKLLFDLGSVLSTEAKLEESESTFREALALQKKLRPDGAPGSGQWIAELAEVLHKERKLSEAESLMREAVIRLTRDMGPDDAEALRCESALLPILLDQGKLAEAEAILLSNWRLGAQGGLGRPTEKEWTLTPEQALHDLTLAIEGPPTNGSLPVCLLARAALYGRRGQSREAAADLAQVVETDREALGLPLIPLWMDSGSTPGYENHRQRLLAHYARLQRGEPESVEARNGRPPQAADPPTAAAIALALLVYPHAASYEATTRPADFAIEHGAHHVRLPHFQMAKGLAEYRLGELESAREWCRRSLTGNGADPATTVMANAVLAMAEAQSKRLPEAQQALSRAQSALQTNQPPSVSGNRDLGDNWTEWLIARFLVNEASGALKPDPSASTGRPAFVSFKTSAPTTDLRRLIVATVNDKPIYESEVRPALDAVEPNLRERYLPDRPAEFQRALEAVRRDTIERLIDRELIFFDAIEAGYDISREYVDEHIASLIRTNYHGDSNVFLKVLAQEGKTVEQLREDFRRQELVLAARHKKIGNPAPTDEQIQQYYLAHETNYWQPEAVQVSLIVLPLSPTNAIGNSESQRKLARVIRERVLAGGDFASEAKLHSQRKPKSEDGSEWFDRGSLRKELDEAAFALKPGDVSEVIEAGDYLYILQLRDRRPARLKSLAEVQNEIRKHLRRQAQETIERDWTATLRSKAVIRRFP